MGALTDTIGEVLERGRILDGKYKLGGVLNQTDRAIVVEGVHIELRERVAVKILLREHSDPRFAARLRREARQSAQIRSEHVVRYLDIGHLADGRPYVVMERLAGETLSARLAKRPLSLEEAVEAVLQTCEALASAHVRGILHRDLRPSNLFCVEGLAQSLSIKVLNFGTARGSDPQGGKEDDGLTVAALALDAPDYKAPEQLSGRRDLDVGVDIWSLGVVFYELLTGRHPFKEAVLESTLRRLLAADVLPAPEIPPAAWEVISRCLKAERSQRFGDIAALADALGPLSGPMTAQYPRRVKQILATPPLITLASDAESEGRIPTVVRDVLALAKESAATLHPAPVLKAKKAAENRPLGIPRLDDGRETGAKSFAWLRLPFARTVEKAKLKADADKDREAPSLSSAPPSVSATEPARARGNGALLIVGSIAVALVAVLVLLRRVVIDVHVGEPVAASQVSAPAVPSVSVLAAPIVASAEPSAEAAPSALAISAAPTARAPEPPSAPAAATKGQLPRAAGARPPQAPKLARPAASAGDDPWGWDR